MTTRLLHILPADNTPEVFLDPEGIIKIKGRGMVLNKTTIPYQINGWIDGYLLNPPEITNIIISFEYLNSHSATILTSTLRKISQVILLNKKLFIHWYHEEDDDYILDRGEHISSALNIPFEFIRIENISAF